MIIISIREYRDIWIQLLEERAFYFAPWDCQVFPKPMQIRLLQKLTKRANSDLRRNSTTWIYFQSSLEPAASIAGKAPSAFTFQ
jgi:hypothetical protein